MEQDDSPRVLFVIFAPQNEANFAEMQHSPDGGPGENSRLFQEENFAN